MNKTTVESSQAGKAVNPLENYNVKDAIRHVQRLSESLIEATKHAKHRFREEWVNQLIARYEQLPGKPLIHLNDLGQDVIPTLCRDVRPLLVPYWKELVAAHGYKWSMAKFRCARDIAAGAKVTRWGKMRSWRKFSALTGFCVDSLEPFVVALRVSNVGTSRVILHPKLPFNLATSAGAKMIGYRGDVTYSTSSFHNQDPLLHQDYKHSITEVIGDNPFTTTPRQDGCDRTNVGVFVTMLASIAGLDNSQKQKRACNPFPGWFFTSAAKADSKVSLLRASWAAEGSPTHNMLQLGQGVDVENASQKLLSEKPGIKHSFNWLEPEARSQMRQRPPLLLVSMLLLLYDLGIIGYMGPQKIWKNKKDGSSTVFWNLTIYRMRNMELFRDVVGFVSPLKQAKLQRFTSHNSDTSSPSSFFFVR